MTKEVQKAVEEAQLVLVGLGNEWETPVDGLKEDPLYGPLVEQAEREEDERLLQYIHFHYFERHPDAKRLEGYRKMERLLQGKNYFIVSLCRDDLIRKSGLDADRIVTPCGGFQARQCEGGCEGDGRGGLLRDEAMQESILKAVDGAIEQGELNREAFPLCPSCKKPLWFNQISSPDYREEGYLPQWEKYTKWLQGTLNRNLCVLELGAGMQFPQIIRFPFEKVAYFNQKSRFFRIHSKLYQLTEELREKGVSIAENSVDFLLKESE